MAEQAGDRLFDTGCVLCGSSVVDIQLGAARENPGAMCCYVCRDSLNARGDYGILDAEITRRKRPPAPSQAERIPEDGFKIGDWVKLDLPNDRGAPLRVAGFGIGDNDELLIYVIAGKGAPFAFKASAMVRCDPPPADGKTTAAGSASTAERVLDSMRREILGFETPCMHERRFRSGICMQCGELGPGEADAGYAIPKAADTPRCGGCGAHYPARSYGWKERCLYCARRSPGGHHEPGQHNNQDPTSDIDERIAASRLRSRESSGRAERAERHPSDYDVDDAPECFSTSGWSGR